MLQQATQGKNWRVGDLARVKDALAAMEEARVIAEKARCKAKSEAVRLEVDQTSLLLDLGATKDEVSSLQSQASKDKEAMEEEYHGGDFFLWVRVCVFKHNICEDPPKVLEGMPDSSDSLPPKFFVNLECPPCPGHCRGHYNRSSSKRGNQGVDEDCCGRGPWQTLVLLSPFLLNDNFL